MLRFSSVILIGISVLAAGSATARAQNGSDIPALRAARAKVSPGDRILLHVVREPELSDSVFVTERGEAAFPKLGTIAVGTLTISELQDTLVARYSQYLRSPAIQIKVLRRVVVNGEVRAPNVYYVDVANNLRDVIARAGGLTENGHRGKVAIVRDGLRIAVPNWEQEEGAAADLLSGDQIVVGRKNWLVINALPAISTAVVLGSFIISLRK